ncbi:MAG: nickel pincer cofactor biosynthesis protein LarC [Eubacterium sp.]|nr:nickel pincer cofactor biosynthesis protein LarC [Eubacterium sp.]
MKVLYFDLGMGAAGDMLSAALYELLDEDSKKSFTEKIENIFAEKKVELAVEESVKCGITGTHFRFTVDGEEEHSHDHHEHDHHHHDEHDHHHHHHHTSMQDIRDMVGQFDIPENVKEQVLKVYKLIAEAESTVHGKTVEEIHFHEVGTMDAVADITSVCLLMDMIRPDRVVATPVHVGSGKVHCMHGILPVPAPATAHILKGVPVYGGRIEGELCTPTGAALIKTFADEFGNMPVMTINKIGYGMGNKDFKVANCVRVMLGEVGSTAGTVCSLECNIDDMTGEELGYAKDELMRCGALDVFSIDADMKKGRPGVLLTVICKTAEKEKMAEEIFRLTSTIGIRQKICERYILDREIKKVSTSFGEVNVKYVSGYGVERCKIEFEDLKRIADEKGISIAEARTLVMSELK